MIKLNFCNFLGWFVVIGLCQFNISFQSPLLFFFFNLTSVAIIVHILCSGLYLFTTDRVWLLLQTSDCLSVTFQFSVFCIQWWESLHTIMFCIQLWYWYVTDQAKLLFPKPSPWFRFPFHTKEIHLGEEGQGGGDNDCNHCLQTCTLVHLLLSWLLSLVSYGPWALSLAYFQFPTLLQILWSLSVIMICIL